MGLGRQIGCTSGVRGARGDAARTRVRDLLKRDSFFETAAGKLVQYRRRKRRRLYIDLDDVEPQSKRMAEAGKDDFQRKILTALKQVGRVAFRGPLALSVQLWTTKATAPQAHTIAKNLLDLLGARRRKVRSSRKHVLYKDDSQVHALAVSCVHGQERPLISIHASSLEAMLDDMELAAEALRILEQSDLDSWHRDDQEREWVTSFRRLIEHEAEYRSRLGDQLYEAMVKMERWYAQRALLTRSATNTAQLSWLFGRPKSDIMRPLTDMWDGVIRGAPLRIQVGQLPVAPGSSAAFKQRIDSELTAFKKKWGWLITPLVVPVALEVIVRPSPATPNAVLHDLDNIVRDYLLPRVVPKFGTVTDHRWTIDFEELRRADPKLAASWGADPTPPKGTRDGVTRYHAWRLPPAAKGTTGFVSVALVADTDFRGDSLQQIDDQIKRWTDVLKLGSARARRRRR
jgi:hypothetical protein